MDGLQWKTLLKWMIWGYPYFWKHPYHIIIRWHYSQAVPADALQSSAAIPRTSATDASAWWLALHFLSGNRGDDELWRLGTPTTQRSQVKRGNDFSATWERSRVWWQGSSDYWLFWILNAQSLALTRSNHDLLWGFRAIAIHGSHETVWDLVRLVFEDVTVVDFDLWSHETWCVIESNYDEWWKIGEWFCDLVSTGAKTRSSGWIWRCVLHRPMPSGPVFLAEKNGQNSK